jgi:D-galacturonate reductase
VHSNQYFHYLASKGEIRVNQAKRGYDVAGDEGGIAWFNPWVNILLARHVLMNN